MTAPKCAKEKATAGRPRVPGVLGFPGNPRLLLDDSRDMISDEHTSPENQVVQWLHYDVNCLLEMLIRI